MNDTAIAITGMGFVLPSTSDGSTSVTEEELANLIPRKLRRFSSRSIPASVYACQQAIEMAALTPELLQKNASLYTSQSGYQHPDFDDFEEAMKDWKPDSDVSMMANLWHSRQINPFIITQALSNNLIGIISQIWQIKGDGAAFIRDQAGSSAALEEARFHLAAGLSDIALVVVSGCNWDCYSAVAEQRPIPENREHTGAAVLVLESERFANQRQAEVIAWLSDYQFQCRSKEESELPTFGHQMGQEWGGVVLGIAQSLEHLSQDRYQGAWRVANSHENGFHAVATLKRN